MIGREISHYRILEELGHGGMGIVYMAEDRRLKRTVALKFLPPQALDKEPDRMRFMREAQAAAALDHPNICTIYEIDEADGQIFIAMAYVEGVTMADRLSEAPMPLNDVLDTGIQLAEALSEAHAHSIVHRDIKSSNVIITPHGVARVMDFGIAKVPGSTRLTETDSTIGSPPYMSPEQSRAREVDHRTDIWSLGVLLYEAVTGRLPFRSDHSQALVYAIVNETEPPPGSIRNDVPPSLDRVITRAMAKNPDDRYQTAAEMAAELRKVADEITGVGKPVPTPLSRRKIFAAAFVVAFSALVVWTAARVFDGRGSPHVITSIAVLPLDNLSEDPEQEFFADGMTDAVTAGLAKIGNLRVISRTSAMQYKHSNKTLPEIADELDVDAILEGSVMRQGDRVRITVQLIRADTDEHMWADDYESDLRDVLALQSDVARSIAREIALQLTDADETRLGSAPEIDPDAFEAYMRGRFHWNKRTPQDILKGLEYFEQAVAIDPDYALAHVGIAESYNLCVSYQMIPPAMGVPKALSAARRALELDATSGAAQSAIAAVDGKACNLVYVIDDYERAVTMSPNYATAHQWYAEALSRLARHDAAIAEIRIAHAIDPLSLPINTTAGTIYYNSRQYDKALTAIQEALELAPAFPPAVGMAAKIYDMNGDYERAMQHYASYMALGGIDERVLTAFARAYEEGGIEYAREWYIESFRAAAVGQVSLGYSLALMHALRDERDEAFHWLEQLSRDHCWNVTDIMVEPMFDSLRDDPRYELLLRRTGFLDSPP